VTRRRLILAAGLGSLLLLFGAWGYQAAGYAPCQLCLWQRWPHAAAALLGLAGVLAPLTPVVAFGAAAALTTSGLGAYHAGVEYGWWPGPSSCAGDAGSLLGMTGAELLSTDGSGGVVLCDEVVWSFLGLSMAGWNALLSLGLAAIWLAAWRLSAR
jgi:disulfide bond formation protein DsbB